MLSGMTLWTRGDDTKPGPRPTYTLDQLADACVVIADADGLSALSMRRVAQHLGTAAASLYRYVEGKDDLLSLMVDRVSAQYDYPETTGDVLSDVLAILEQSRVIYRNHPWLAKAAATELGPNSMRYLDRMAGALAPAGLGAGATMMGVAMLSGWVMTFAAQDAAGAATGSAGSQQITRMMDNERYPNLAVLFARTDTAEVVPDSDTTFRAGIEALLFGFASNE